MKKIAVILLAVVVIDLIRLSNACQPQWSVLPDTNSLNGVRPYTVLEVCQEYCVNVSTCVAVDFDLNDYSCWLHTNASDLQPINTYYQNNTHQYRIDRTCATTAPACQPQWSVHRNQNSINGVRFDAYTTLAACQAYCATVPTCVAVDFTFDENSCWLHVKPHDLWLNNTYSQPGTSQYQINRTCSTKTSTAEMTPSSTTSSQTFNNQASAHHPVLNTGTLIGIVAGSLACVGIIIVTIVVAVACNRKRTEMRRNKPPPPRTQAVNSDYASLHRSAVGSSAYENIQQSSLSRDGKHSRDAFAQFDNVYDDIDSTAGCGSPVSSYLDIQAERASTASSSDNSCNQSPQPSQPNAHNKLHSYLSLY